MGNSAGGHLALTTGMIPASASLDSLCPGTEELKVAAIINWYGITDVNELLAGPNVRNFAVMWLGGMSSCDELAKRVSPLTYVRAGLPPIISIQGDADPIVPYSQNVRLHQALDKAGIRNEFVNNPRRKTWRFFRRGDGQGLRRNSRLSRQAEYRPAGRELSSFCRDHSPRVQHRVDQRRLAGLDLGDGAPERWRDVLRLLDRALGVPAASLRERPKSGSGPTMSWPIWARPTGVPRCSATWIWCSQSL